MQHTEASSSSSEFRKKKQEIAMGSLMSPVVASLHVEHFESKTLDTTPKLEAMWYRYVDDQNSWASNELIFQSPQFHY